MVASTPIRIFGTSIPTYDDLAAESWDLAFGRTFPEDTLRDRLDYAIRAHRLACAAQWQKLDGLDFRGYYLNFIVSRLVPALAAVLLGIYLWDVPDRAAPEIWVIVQLLVLAFATASVWAILHWPQPQKDLAFAAQYRASRVERERQLLSPHGWNGWRAERRDDGSYVMVPVAGVTPPDPVA